MQQIVTFVGAEIKTGNGQNGPWTLKTYKDAGGNKYQTFKPELQQIADSLMGVAVSITWDVETRNYTDNQGAARTANNNVLTSVEAAAAGAQPQPQPQGQVQGQATGFPTGQQPVPQPQQATAPAFDRNAFEVAKQSTINRSAALARAIEAHAAGIAVVSDPAQLAAVADLFVKYIETGSF